MPERKLARGKEVGGESKRGWVCGQTSQMLVGHGEGVVDLGFSSEEAGEPGGFQKRRDWCDVCPNWFLSCGL